MTTSKTETPSAVEDRELMRYYDGELDDDRAEEIERWLEVSDDGLDKLAALDLAGDLIREAVDQDERADDVVDAVMARLEEGEQQGDAEPEDVSADLAPPKKHGPPAEAANDNSMRIYVLAAAAAAAAAGLFFWGNQGPTDLEPPPHARYAPSATATSEPAPKPAPETLAEATVDDEDEGVEIAAVDFGAHRGSVFYVGDEAAGRTPVVWINDVGEQ